MEPNSSQSSRFDPLEQTLEMFVENARHLCVMASDFQPTNNGQSILNQKLQTMVSGLLELDQLKNQYQDVKIPSELFEYVDVGKNPQLYTKDVMENSLQKNKEVNGKIELYKKFRAYLLKELSEEFPKETVQYRAIREMGVATSFVMPKDENK